MAFLHDNAAFGGMETLQVEIVRHLDRERYEPTVVIAAPIDLESSQRFERLLADVGARCILPFADRHTGVSGSATRRLARLLRRERFDVAHIQTRTPLASRRLTLAAAIARTPAVVRTEHVSPGPHVDRTTWLAARPFDWLTDVVMTDSNGDRAQQLDLVRRSPDKVVTSYCGIDPAEFDPDHDPAVAKDALGLDPSTLVVGTVGRLHAQKGHRHLVGAAQQVIARRDQPVTFLLVGDGPEEASLRAQVEACGIASHVQFVGYQSDPLPYMQAMDVVAMPSLWEGFSICMQQFMALGKPMITSDHHSFREAMVHGEHGWIVPTGDDTALATGIIALLDDPALRQRLGAAASERARREFSIATHVADLMAVYDRLLERRPARSARAS